MKFFFAWLRSVLFAPIEIILAGGCDFFLANFKETQHYLYEVEKAHLTGDWKYLHEKYGKTDHDPLPPTK